MNYLSTRRVFNLQKGFTLIEMLVVLAIAAMLLSAVLVIFQQTRSRSRDATREQDMKTIQNGLAIYATARGGYPVYTGYLTGSDAASNGLRIADALPQMPHDPLDNGNYRYYYTSDGSTYLLKYYLETDSITGKSSGLNQASP